MSGTASADDAAAGNVEAGQAKSATCMACHGMDGNSANDGPYSIEDVPWVMYFEASFALHGAFWHEGFGGMRSHGCVNLAPSDARWFFQWTEPQVPTGWHGAYATAQRPGTRVYVHYDEQALGERGGPEAVPQH